MSEISRVRSPIHHFRIALLMSVAIASNGCGAFDRAPSNEDKLETIAFAVNNYRDTFHEFPPIVVTSTAGDSLHSWRVLILPFVEANDFYEQYDFDSAWNSDRNVDLRDGTRKIEGGKFPVPSRAGDIYLPGNSPRMLETIFVALVNGQLREKDYQLPTTKTETGHFLPDEQPFVVLEIKHSGIHWMEPRDVTMPMERFPDWLNLDDVRDQIVRSIEIGDTTIMRDHDETLAYLDSLREHP